MTTTNFDTNVTKFLDTLSLQRCEGNSQRLEHNWVQNKAVLLQKKGLGDTVRLTLLLELLCQLGRHMCPGSGVVLFGGRLVVPGGCGGHDQATKDVVDLS